MKIQKTQTRTEVIGVIGAGYVGLVTAATLASLGHEVVVVDVDADKIARLRHGDVPMVELGLPELLHQHRDRLTWSLDRPWILAASRKAERGCRNRCELIIAVWAWP